MTDKEIIDGLYEIKNWKCNGDSKMHSIIRGAIDLLEQTRWIPVSERYPKIEDEYKYFLVTDDKGKVSVQEFFISLDEEPQPYFSGMVNVIAWMPLPQPYVPDTNVGEMVESEEEDADSN